MRDTYYHRNALGSVMEISTASQTEAASYWYSPYGEVTVTQSGVVQGNDPLGQRWGFTARMNDAESGLLYLRRRHYDPSNGRFAQRDPVLAFDLYSYANHSPPQWTDPLGKTPVRPPGGPKASESDVKRTGGGNNLRVENSLRFSPSGDKVDAKPGERWAIEQKISFTVWTWGRDGTTSKVRRYEIVEYFEYKGVSDNHSVPLLRSGETSEQFCAYFIFVVSELTGGVITNYNEGGGYHSHYVKSSTVSEDGGRPVNFNMKPGSTRTNQPGIEFEPRTLTNWYSYTSSGNWCEKASLRTQEEWGAGCGQDFRSGGGRDRRPRGPVTGPDTLPPITDPDPAPTTPSNPSKPAAGLH